VAVRVLHVITRLEPGGAQRNTLYTCGHLDRRRFQVALAWGPGDALDRQAGELAEVSLYPITDMVRPVAPGSDFNALCQLRAVIRDFAPEVVHSHSSKAGVLGRVAARLEGVPAVVHSIHGFGFTPRQPLPVRAAFYLLERCVAPCTDHFVAVSEANAGLGVELGLFPSDRVSVIRSGIDLERFRRATAGLTPGGAPADSASGPLVVQIGNFKPQKAPLDFIWVAAAVADEVPDVRFAMTGDGELRAAAQSLAERLGILSRLRFCGWLDDVTGLLAEASVSVLTSYHEGLPRAVVESLASGVPVVATSVDGVPEVVRHGVNGLLAEAGDVSALAGSVVRILSRPELHARLAAAAPEGLDDFDIDEMVRQQEDLYTWLLGRNPS
jgi:glycosyltransferase involved in cell wall biosynthesis